MRILITGASHGLGAVVVKHLDAHELILVSRSVQSEKHRCIPLDFRDIQTPRNWDVANVDAVIHCAGGGLGMKSPTPSPQELYDLFMVNLGGQVYLNNIVLPDMIRRKQGYICHVCSIASGEAVGSVGYNTMKASLAAYVRSLGREMAPHNIVITGISPGGFRCPDNAMDRLEKNNPKAYQDFIEKRLPRGHMGEAEELLPIIDFLISHKASMMGGSVIPIDAGEGHYYA